MKSGIYAITHVESGRKYVGQSSDMPRRWRRHIQLARLGDGRHLYCAIRKYGADAFKFEVLETCCPEMLNERELHWIAALGTFSDGFNLTIGGDGVRGHKWSDEAKARISASVSARMTPEHRKLLSDLNKGRGVSEEAARKMGVTRRGRKLSDEHRRKISEGRKGLKLSESHRAALSAAAKRRCARQKGA
jgi:group I intron endonuclease